MRSAVVLVRATVAEAFRDAKRGGGVKSALTGLPADGLEGIAFVLSPNARKVVTMALERNPSGTEKSVCMSYMLREEEAGVDRKRQIDVDRRIARVGMSGETESVVDGTVVKAEGGGLAGIE